MTDPRLFAPEQRCSHCGAKIMDGGIWTCRCREEWRRLEWLCLFAIGVYVLAFAFGVVALIAKCC